LKRRDEELARDLKDLKLKGVKTESQVTYPSYTANSQLKDEESNEGENSPTQIDFEVEPPPHFLLLTIRKDFKINFKILSQDIEKEENLERRQCYRERFSLEQKKQIFSHWKIVMNELQLDIFSIKGSVLGQWNQAKIHNLLLFSEILCYPSQNIVIFFHCFQKSCTQMFSTF
jgi:hypothetical protein